MEENKVANPGSDEAVEAGCSCPIIDNCHGRGVYWGDGGTPVFWMNSDCEIHSKEPK